MVVYPGNPAVGILTSTLWKKDGYRGPTQFIGTVHAGTHYDCPSHMIGHAFDGETADRVALDKCIGEALVINVPKAPLENITADDLKEYGDEIKETKRVLLNTGWHKQWDKPNYNEEFPGMSVEAAKFLGERGIYLVGVDMPTLNAKDPHANDAAHFAILSKGALLIESLANLNALTKKCVQFVGLPLKLVGVEASPIRAIAIEED